MSAGEPEDAAPAEDPEPVATSEDPTTGNGAAVAPAAGDEPPTPSGAADSANVPDGASVTSEPELAGSDPEGEYEARRLRSARAAAGGAVAEPQRRCVGCGESRPQRELVRFVRAGEGIRLDPEGRAPGRGAYLCRRAECAEQALRRRSFQRSFRGPVAVPGNLIELTANG